MANPIGQQFCPLGDEHCAMLTTIAQNCHDLQCYLDKLAAIGLDVSEWTARNQSTKALADGLKAVHFPGQP